MEVYVNVYSSLIREPGAIMLLKTFSPKHIEVINHLTKCIQQSAFNLAAYRRDSFPTESLANRPATDTSYAMRIYT